MRHAKKTAKNNHKTLIMIIHSNLKVKTKKLNFLFLTSILFVAFNLESCNSKKETKDETTS